MARKIIKAILFILAAVVVAGGIMTYLRSQKKIPSPIAQTTRPSEPSVPKTSQIKQLTVSSQGSSAQVQIQGIREHNYSISHLAEDEGFKIQVPHAQIEQVQRLLDKPHPLIKKIEVRELPEDPTTAELIFHTEKNVNFLDTQKNDTLTIDFVKTDAQPELAAQEPEAVIAPKVSKSATTKGSNSSTASKSAASKKAKAAISKKTKSSAKVAHKSTKSKSGSGVKLQPFDPNMVDNSDIDAQSETLIPQEKTRPDQTDHSMDLSSFGNNGSAPSTEKIPQQEEVPTIQADNAPKPTEDNDGFNLKDVVKEEPKAAAPAGNANLLDAETEMSLKDNLGKTGPVAALPNNQKFDLNKVQANLPALQNVLVQRNGTATTVTFDREKAMPYKVFRMVNPSRIVVDFKDAKNNLKSDYPRFAGTKISRIETRAYAAPDGQLVRVIMYVDGAPNYKSDKKGTQLVLELQ
jgi:hypothetical protein